MARLIDANKLESYFHETKMIEVFPYWLELDADTKTELCKFGAAVKQIIQNHPTAVKEIEELQGEAYDLGVESTLRNHFGLSWHDAAEVRKEVAQIKAASAWIPVTERLPEEHESIFAKAYGTEKWNSLMFRNISDDVLAVVKYEDGTKKVKTVHTTDGEWRFTNLYGAKEVTHWMPLPEPPKVGES